MIEIEGDTALNVAGAVIQVLRNYGIDRIFGNPGTTEVPLLDALPDQGIHFHLCLSEGIAVAMADGYGRATGQVGVVMVHTAVGAAQTLMNLVNAWGDHRPLLVIAGEKDSRLQGRGHVAEVPDLPGINRQVTKFTATAHRPEQVPELVARALQAAMATPAGPTFLAVPEDFWTAPAPPAEALQPLRPTQILGPEPAAEGVAAALALLRKARRPVVVVGDELGLAQNLTGVVRLAEQLQAPVVDGLLHAIMATNFPRRHPLYHGPVFPGQPPLAEADVVVALGCRLFREYSPAERDLLPAGATLIQVSAHALELGRLYPAAVALLAEPHRAAERLAADLKAEMPLPGVLEERTKWLQELQPRRYPTCQPRLPAEQAPDIQELVAVLGTTLPANAVVVDESVLSTFFLHQGYPFDQPGSYVSTSGAGLGWGPGAALGMQLGRPDRPVVCFIGDGSLLFSVQALWTAANLGAGVTFVVLNNGGYMAVRKALGGYGGNAAATGCFTGWQFQTPAIDLPGLARALGVPARTVDRAGNLAPALRAALDSGGPSLIDVRLIPDSYIG